MTLDRLTQLANYVEGLGNALFARAEAAGRNDYHLLTREELAEASKLSNLLSLVQKQCRDLRRKEEEATKLSAHVAHDSECTEILKELKRVKLLDLRTSLQRS